MQRVAEVAVTDAWLAWVSEPDPPNQTEFGLLEDGAVVGEARRLVVVDDALVDELARLVFIGLKEVGKARDFAVATSSPATKSRTTRRCVSDSIDKQNGALRRAPSNYNLSPTT
jgi:hypothetical protein